MNKEVVSESVEQTCEVARFLVEELNNAEPQEEATVVGMNGELGSGKTTFTQCFAKALGVEEKVTSPTFVILKKYEIPSFAKATEGKRKFKTLIHIDAYRLDGEKDMASLDWSSFAKNPENIILIEWVDRIDFLLHKKCVKINFKHIDENKRKITVNF